MITGVESRNGIPHDKYIIRGIAHVRRNRKKGHFHAKTTVHWRSTHGIGHIPLRRCSDYCRCAAIFDQGNNKTGYLLDILRIVWWYLGDNFVVFWQHFGNNLVLLGQYMLRWYFNDIWVNSSVIFGWNFGSILGIIGWYWVDINQKLHHEGMAEHKLDLSFISEGNLAL